MSGVVKVGARSPRAAWVAECTRLIKEHVHHYELDLSDVVSIGLGIPAGIDPRTAKITHVTSPDYDLAGKPAEWFQSDFPDVPIIPDNDANFAAYGEHLYGAGRGINMMLYVKASRTIGAGLMINGAIIRGRHGLASELGHLRLHPRGIVCRCGNRGCLETLVAGPRLLAQVREAYDGYLAPADHGQCEPHNLDELIQQATEGDLVCRRVLRDAARTIGVAVAQACNLVNPELVVLGGDLGQAADLLVEPATDGLREHALSGMFTHPDPCRIVGTELEELAGARGAMAFGLITEPPIRVRGGGHSL
jgi:predicted NBD/HSP70 family sugar kinase